MISTYRFAGDASPATVPRTSLPMLPKAAYAQACDLFDEIAAAAGLTAVKSAGRGRDGRHVFELEADTEVETQRLRHNDGHGARALRACARARAPMRRQRCAARAASTIRPGCGLTRISSTGAVTASASTTP